MPDRSGRQLAAAPLLLVVAVAVLVTFDTITVLDDPGTVNRIHTLIVATLIVGSIKVLLDHARRTIAAEIRALNAEIDTCRTECQEACREVTRPLPLRAVASVAVPVVGTPPDLPPDNVRSFEVGRRLGRMEGRAD